jgi:hypothetical protein
VRWQMKHDIFKELGSKCWYCGNANPIHQKCSGFEANACRSCIHLSGMGGVERLEEFRHDLAVRKIAPGIDLKSLTDPITITTPEQNRVVKQVIERIEAKIKCYKFYFEHLALDSSRDIEPGNKTRRYEVKALSSADLLKELGSKCWYCGTLLYRHKQHWKKVKYRLWNGKYEEGIELEKTTPYDGRPTHDNFVDFTVNSCRSCTSRRCRKPIEEFRKWLGMRIMPERNELQSLEAAMQSGLVDGVQERKVVEEAIQLLNSKAQAYLFYLEELMIHCGDQWELASSKTEEITIPELAEVSPQQFPWD